MRRTEQPETRSSHQGGISSHSRSDGEVGPRGLLSSPLLRCNIVNPLFLDHGRDVVAVGLLLPTQNTVRLKTLRNISSAYTVLRLLVHGKENRSSQRLRIEISHCVFE